jgi:hypothetical protein
MVLTMDGVRVRCVLGVLLLVSACGDDGPTNHLPDAPPADSPPDAPACAPVVGAGTVHTANVATAETWTAAASPHNVPNDISITGALTIEPCAVVRIGGDHSITVRQGGSFTAAGMAGLPVLIERLDSTNSWATLSVLGGGRISLTYTNVDGGGDPLNTIPSLAGALDVAGTTPTPENALHVDHVTISGSESQGLNLHDGGGIDSTSTALTIIGSALAPIVTYARLVGTIPAGTYTGNAEDAIVIRGTGGPEAMAESATIHDRGVPYRVGVNANAVLDIANIAAPPTVTIEPGVTLKFNTGATLRVDASSGTTPAAGALVAVGTAAKPITFTSSAASPAPGDWYGIWLGRQPLATTLIDHAVIEYAGRASNSGTDSCLVGPAGVQNDAAIRILGGEPANAPVTNSTIKDSARFGIDRGFRSDTKPSYLATNNFVNIVGGCKETYPRDLNGACPTTLPCP